MGGALVDTVLYTLEDALKRIAENNKRLSDAEVDIFDLDLDLYRSVYLSICLSI